MKSATWHPRGAILIAAMLSGATVCLGQAAATRPAAVAVVGLVKAPSTPADARLAGSFVALLEGEMAEQPRLRLVERQAIGHALDELRLSLSALADPQSRLRVGRLVEADFIVWAEPARAVEAGVAGTGPALLLRVVEARSGVLRGAGAVGALTDAGLPAAAADAAEAVARVIASPRPPMATVAVGLFENAGQFERLRPLAFLLRDQFTRELLRRPSLLVLQRAAMGPLLAEMDLARSGLVEADAALVPAARATWLLSGNFRDVVGSDPPRVQVRMDLVNAASGEKALSEQDERPVADLPSLYPIWAELIDRKTGAGAPPPAAPAGAQALPDEAQALVRRAVIDLAHTISVRVPTVKWPDVPFAQRASVGQPVHGALLRQAIERLEAALFLTPSDLATKALVASAYAVPDTTTWDAERAAALYQDICRADPDHELGLFALAELPRVYDADYCQYSSAHHGRVETMRACIQAYIILADKLADRDLGRSASARCEAARGAFFYLKDYGTVMTCLHADAVLALKAGPQGRLEAQIPLFPFEFTAQMLATLAKADPLRAGECRELMQKWTEHPSPYLRYFGLKYLSRMKEESGDFRGAGRDSTAAAELCAGQTDNWFPGREPEARCAAARAYQKEGDIAAALAVLEPLTSHFEDPGRFNEEVCLTLGKIYETSGDRDRAVDLYRRFADAHPRWSSWAVDRYRKLLHERDAERGGAGLVDYRLRQPLPANVLCAGGERIWLADFYRLQWFDPRTGEGGRLRRAFDREVAVIHALAWTEPFLWIGTGRDGLWRLDTRGGPEEWDKEDHWLHVGGLPDRNVTALASDDDGNVYAGVGVITTGVGGPIQGGVARITSDGHVSALDGAGSPRLAPERLAWVRPALWGSAFNGLYRYDAQTSAWTCFFPDRRVPVSAGAGRILVTFFDAPRNSVTAGAFAPGAPATARPDVILTAPMLLSLFAVESPDHLWFGGRGPGVRETHELQCFAKNTGALLTLDGQAGPPFEGVGGAIWFKGQLWLATRAGAVSIDAVHIPAAAATQPATAPESATLPSNRTAQ